MKYVTLTFLAGQAVVSADATSFNLTFENQDTNVIITNNTITDMRQQFKDYFRDQYEDWNTTSLNDCSTTQECDDDNSIEQCCSKSVISEVGGTTDTIYKCMSKYVAGANIDLSLSDYSVTMKCVGSGAHQLVAGAAVALASSLTLF